MHLSNQTWYNKQRPFVRLNGFGDIIPGSIVFRDRQPKMGNWRQLGFINACCSGIGDSLIIFSNTTASANITAITTSDGRVNWAGTLANGELIAFTIPGGIDETFSVTVDTPSSRTITNTTAQGNGVISTIGAITLATNSFTTTAVPSTQYLSVLS